MILLTGVTGTIGAQVLRGMPPGVPVRVLARDPARVPSSSAQVEAVAGDYGDPASLAAALRGVRTAFLVTARVGGDHDAAFVAAAREAGVRHVVKLSAAAVEDPGATDAITGWQRESEALLRDSGLAWTFLRPRAFMSNTLSWAGSVRAEGVVRALYGRAPNACVDPRDVAAVAVAALVEPGHEGRTHVLTGPEPVTAVQQTEELSRVLGVGLRFEELTADAARAALYARHPRWLADALLHSAGRQRDGAKARVTDTVARVTGRPARAFATWAGDHRSAFAPAGGTTAGR
ncbi:NAD(P)H-binding protein [Actinacidiphila acididurans]|uniref:NAD(P)H-binding protein n=1 Tax=Actinacidiphila acididurans TaxID=2784346 RepID=A0ABS2TYB7_9ACTN|nr:NAD(P)H-binding protein [Actinacidiphila acididurans]MBM9507275.1 NAD(P)H-binding protein [Actinacidiphila acididurans]